MKLTEHFTTEEMERSSTAIRLGIDNKCPKELISNMYKVAKSLELVREHFKQPVHVTSCYRSPAVNHAVGGSETSAHRFAFAADFEVSGVANLDVCKWCAENIPDYDQIIYEFGPSGWVHMGFTLVKPRKQLLSAVKEGSKTVYKKGLIA